MTVDVDAVLGIAVNVVALIAAVAAGVVWLRKWLRKQVAEPAQESARQLTANGGQSAYDYAKSAAQSSGKVVGRLDEIQATTEENHRLATQALTLARDNGVRLDRHLVEDHGRE